MNIKTNNEERDIVKKKCRELHFEEKELIASEIPGENSYNVAALCGLKNIFPNIYRQGDLVSVVDCETGKRYDTHIHPGRDDMINSGLRNLWNEDNRCNKFHDGDIIGIALDPENNHILYICFKYQEVKKRIDEKRRKKAIWFEKELMHIDVNDKDSVIQLNSRLYPREFVDNLPRYNARFVLVDVRAWTSHNVRMHERAYQITGAGVILRNHPNRKIGDIIGIAISPENKNDLWIDFKYDKEKKDIDFQKKTDSKFENEKKDGEKMVNEKENDNKTVVNMDMDNVLKFIRSSNDPELPIMKTAMEERITIIQRIKEDEEKTRLLEKEKERKKKIDENLENISVEAKKAVKNGTLFLEGPPGTSKTHDAEKIACEIVNAYIAYKEKDLTFEKLKDMGFVNRIELDSSWSSSDLMGGMTYYTEEEDKIADNVRPVSKSGILTKMNKRNIGLALGLNIEEIECNTNSGLFDKHKERIGDKNIYKYAKRHILLVEEASRGNFESTFGGNMTILESERRLGEDNQTYVTNRSGYCRALAPSMIVICTRNIADKGAKSIDIGIMRRFPRVYRGPDFKRIENYINDEDNKEKLKNGGVYECIDRSMRALPIINNRICIQLGIDYQIGHTYLYVKTKDELMSKWTDWILPSILDRCNRKLDVFSDILFGEDQPEMIDKQKGVPEFKNIEDLDNFINKIIGSEKDE